MSKRTVREYAFMERPDSSGARGGFNRRPQSRGPEWPYDRELSYGQPHAHPKADGATGRAVKRPAKRRAKTETIGVPFDLGMSDGHSANGVGVIPGQERGWASSGRVNLDQPDDDDAKTIDEGTMKLNEVRKIVDEVVEGLFGWSSDPAFDYSQPLGVDNLYKRQGASNMGSWTSECVDRRGKFSAEGVLRLAVRSMIADAIERRRP